MSHFLRHLVWSFIQVMNKLSEKLDFNFSWKNQNLFFSKKMLPIDIRCISQYLWCFNQYIFCCFFKSVAAYRTTTTYYIPTLSSSMLLYTVFLRTSILRHMTKSFDLPLHNWYYSHHFLFAQFISLHVPSVSCLSNYFTILISSEFLSSFLWPPINLLFHQWLSGTFCSSLLSIR